MAESEVNVVATFKAKLNEVRSVRQSLEKMVSPTRAEEGNLGYDLHQSADDPTTFVLYEHWRSRSDLKTHMQQPHFRQMDTELSKALVHPYSVTVLRHIAGGHSG